MELVILEFDYGMATRHRDIIDSQVRFMTTTQLEAVLLVSRSDDVYDSRSVLLLVETLQHQIVTFWSFIVNQVVGPVLRSDL